jgi:hypothetical protein
MKKFSQFIIEAKETRASEQAKKLGLVGDGHGDWYNAQGEFVAKTVKGKLEFFTKGQRVGQRDIPPKPGTSAPQQTAQSQAQAANSQQVFPQAAGKKQQELPGEDEYLTIVFGRFNPPTKEHKKLFTEAERIAAGGEIRIYPSRTQDSKLAPLDTNKKVTYLRKMFPKYADDIINNPEMKTIFDALISANEDGYQNLNIIVGSDRQAEVQNLSNKYNGKFYQFVEINVIPTGNFDSKKDSSGISSAMLRKAAADNDFREFGRGMPKGFDETQTRRLFNDVRKGMGFKTNVKENYKLWEVAPELDYKNLRENYIQDKIFKIGNIVENTNTGLVGKIIRRGTNYLICVTENDIMFKSWIKDLIEYTEVKMNSMYRLPGKPNTLAGTKGYFKYAAKMTPGTVGTGKENLQAGGKAYGVNFINKYKKIKESIYSNV